MILSVRCVALYYIAVNYTTLHYTTLHYTTLHYTTLHYTTLHYTTLHYTTLHYTTLHQTTLHHTTLHYTALHFIVYYYYSLTVAGKSVNCFYVLLLECCTNWSLRTVDSSYRFVEIASKFLPLNFSQISLLLCFHDEFPYLFLHFHRSVAQPQYAHTRDPSRFWEFTQTSSSQRDTFPVHQSTTPYRHSTPYVPTPHVDSRYDNIKDTKVIV